MPETKYERENPILTVEIEGETYVVDMRDGRTLSEPLNMTRLLELAFLAKRSGEAWGEAEAASKAMIGWHLREAGVDMARSGLGSAHLVPGENVRVPAGSEFMGWLKGTNWPLTALLELLSVVETFRANDFIVLAQSHGIDPEAVVVRKPYEFVTLKKPTTKAPAVSRTSHD